MFKYYALILAGIFTLSPAAEPISDESAQTALIEPSAYGGTADDASSGSMMIINPMKKKNSADEINAEVGCAITVPDNFSAEEESFYVYNVTPLMGQYKFTADGVKYTLRASRTSDDISGVYVGGATLSAYADENGTDAVILDDAVWMRRFIGEMQYSLYAESTPETAADEVSAVLDALIPAAE